MDIIQKFLGFALLGAEWVLWLLILLSVVSVGVMIERLIFGFQRMMEYDILAHDVKTALTRGEPQAVANKYGSSGALPAVVAVAGLREVGRGTGAVAEAMVGAKVRARAQYERGLAILGTLGNNAPFVGLFGTVLGIIKAFHDLSRSSSNASEAVMAGISEALVATMVGLGVAIPAVVAFNIAQRWVRNQVAKSDAIAHVILTEMRAEGKATAGKSAEAA